MRWLERNRLTTRMALAINQRRYPEVLDICDALLGLDPKDVSALAMKADVLERINRTDAAINVWHELLRVDQTNFAALRRLSDHYRLRGDTNEACSYARRAVEAYRRDTLSDKDFRFIAFVARLFGGGNDIADEARRHDRSAANEDQEWVEEAEHFLAACTDG